MLSKIRDRLKPLIETVAAPFVRLGLSPNHITFIAFFLGIIAAVLFATEKFRLAGVVVLIGGFFDMIDGAVARLTDKVTRFGGVLDSVLDRVTDAILYFGILAGRISSMMGEPYWVLPVGALIGSLLVSYVRSRAESAGTGKLDVGIAERAERLIILAIGAILNLLSYALAIIVILTFITVIQRLWVSWRRLAS